RSPGGRVHRIEFGPRPSAAVLARPLRARHFALDHRRIESTISVGQPNAAEIGRAATTYDVDWVHTIGTETERPGQPTGENFSVHLAIRTAKLDFDFVVVADHARELRRCSFEVLFAIRTDDGRTESERAGLLGACLQIHGPHIRLTPNPS